MVNTKVPRWQRLSAIPCMLIFGTATVVTQKFLFEQSSEGRYGIVHKFRKPWFQTNAMFVGMTLSYLAYLAIGKKDMEELGGEQNISGKKKSGWKLYLSGLPPALFDLGATALMNVQLLYINASVWQMLRGSTVIFTAILSVFVLKRPHFPYMWWAITFVVIALVVVGLATVFSTGAGKSGVSTERVILAIFLTIVAQVIQASQFVIEEFLLHDLDTHPLQLVGLKGFWGFIICTSIAFPIIQNTNHTEGNGVHEDVFDTFIMLKNSTLILSFMILYVFFILFYNIGGMLVTNVFSAVYRSILVGLRTLCIWAVQIILYYALKNNETVGEEWNRWSFMQLAGFLLLFTGTLMYNKIVRLPGLKYPDDIEVDAKMSQPLLSGTNADAKL
jgi:drug/metabolite transporter (DMT)-like permease